MNILTSLYLQSSPYFEVVRKGLRAAEFNEQSICDRLGLPALCDFLSSRQKSITRPKESDALNFLTRLLLLGESFPREALESAITSPFVVALEFLGLASVDPADGSRLLCPVVLYPVGDMFIVSDRWVTTDGRNIMVPDDFVYPALTPNTADFLANLPLTPCDSFLELCSGTGAVALAASRYAKKAWAIDITERSTEMAEFNRLLNGRENVTALKGNLYEGVEGLQFDRIAAHPPYMPVLSPAQVFYDGGADGEQITRRIVEALPRFLKPGGCFYCLAQGSDRAGAPFEARLRSWLGEDQADFDVAVVEKRPQDPKDAAFVYALKTKSGFETVDLMRNSLSKLGVESMCYGWMLIQRKNETRGAFTVRRSMSAKTGREEFAWLLKWETFAARPSALEELQEMRPLARPGTELHAIHRMKDGALVADQLTLHTENPFAMSCPVDPWVVFLIPLCDGQSTLRQIWETCRASGYVLPETSLQEFAGLLGVLISGGFLEVGDFRPPDPPAAKGRAALSPEGLQNQGL